MALISMVVTSIVPWPPYRFPDDQLLELVNIAAAFENDSEGAASGVVWVQIVEPQELAKVQPEGGYIHDGQSSSPNDRRRKRGCSPGRPKKIQDRFLTHQPRNDERA